MRKIKFDLFSKNWKKLLCAEAFSIYTLYLIVQLKPSTNLTQALQDSQLRYFGYCVAFALYKIGAATLYAALGTFVILIGADDTMEDDTPHKIFLGFFIMAALYQIIKRLVS